MIGKVLAGVSAVLIMSAFLTTDIFAEENIYVGGTVTGGGSISGAVKYGGPPKDVRIPVMKEKNGASCSRHPDTKDGARMDQKISSVNGLLQNAVVFIENIEQGKEWESVNGGKGGAGPGFTNFHFKDCEILPKITVIRKTGKGQKEGNLTIASHDEGVLHNPIGYLVSGSSRNVLFNNPLSFKGAVVDVTKSLKRLKKKDRHFLLQCGQHNYVESDARIVWNPYYFITGADGSYKLEKVPAGKYRVTAWHPYAGDQTREVTVRDGSDTHSDFEIE